MFNKYFGNYIFANNVVTKEQLQDVLNAQSSTRVKLGILAIESGYMDSHQVNQVHRKQAEQDKRFGDIAVSEGFLSEENVSELLDKQKNSHIMLGQILVDKEILTYEEYENLLKSYKKDSGFSDAEIEILKSNDTDAIIEMIVSIGKTEDVELFKEYVELFIRNVVRFIDPEVIIDKPYERDSYKFKNFSRQLIHGAFEIETGMSGPDDTMIAFASKYAEESFDKIDENVMDSLGEFMNCQNGLFVSNLYHRNLNCDLHPQMYMENGKVNPKNKIFILPCKLSFGEIDIIFNI